MKASQALLERRANNVRRVTDMGRIARAGLRGRWAGLLGAALLTLFCASLWSEPAKPDIQYSVKAVFLFNFSQYVEWPARAFSSPTAPITIAVLGEDPFGQALDEAVRGEVVNSRKLVVKRIRSLDEAKDCHILFLSRTEKERQPALLDGLKGLPVLTVSEADRFCQGGGMINFYMQDNKVKFEANPDAAEQVGLKLSSKMLKLARIVKTETKGTGKP